MAWSPWKHSLIAYNGLVPMSPKTTPRAPNASDIVRGSEDHSGWLLEEILLLIFTHTGFLRFLMAFSETDPRNISSSYSVLLKVTMAADIVTAVKAARNAISTKMVPKSAPLNRMDFNALTAYASGFTFANALSHGGKLAMG